MPIPAMPVKACHPQFQVLQSTKMTFYKFKIYAKMTGVGLVFAIALAFVASNRETVQVKFLHWVIWQAPLFALITAAAGMGVGVYLATRRIRKVLVEYKEMRREEKSRQELVKNVKKDIENEDNLN